MIYDLPLWQHLALALLFFAIAYRSLRSTKKHSSYALDDISFTNAEAGRLTKRFAGWMSIIMGVFMLYLLRFRKW